MKILRGGLQKFLETRKGGSEKIVELVEGLQKSVFFKTNRGKGAPKKLKPC